MRLPPFDQVLERYGGDVWRFAASQVGRDRADDLFQETMLAALAAYPKLRDPSSTRSWLLRIAARKAVDAFRADARTAAAPGEAGDPAAAQPAADDELWSRVAQLPDKQRHAVARRFVLDLRYADIGAAMGTSPEAARRNVFEALKALRTAMNPLEAA
jgi:RNA polymerase sigma factor (sigma-70 family)